MVTVRPFAALRPAPGREADVVAPPYDVVSRAEARALAAGRPWSFLRVSRPELELAEPLDPYSAEVYARARGNLESFVAQGVLVRDAEPGFSIYRQTLDGRSQTGLVATVSIDEYASGLIKQHELTTVDKEADRIAHFDAADANTEPIFLTYRARASIDALVSGWVGSRAPDCDLTTDDAVTHQIWKVTASAAVASLEAAFGDVPALYIADGHHRAASAAKVGQRRRAARPGWTGDEEFNYVMAVVFPDEQLRVFDYNRVVKDLGGLTPAGLLAGLAADFSVEVVGGAGAPHRPARKGEFGMFLDGKWHALRVRDGVADPADPVASLDVAVLQARVLAPLLGVANPRADGRIAFVGGSRGLAALEAAAGASGVAFAVHPVAVQDLASVADAGQIMPPKSTWFEPKLASGLFIHELA
ncbi:MAG: DUF1015 family protein [Bifidobacteriaceae bacterium]|jgi:uncharacterized protein (DUF1015 family)|nr:DUF1015 family protein [Bifidobacteriaceae bacterium]